MKRIVIVLSIIAVGLIGAAIGYHSSNYTSSESPVVEVLFDGGAAHVRRVNMIPSKEEYMYSLVARIDSRGVSNTAATSISGSKPLDAGTQDGVTIHTKSITEKVLIKQLYDNEDDLTPKDLRLAVRLSPNRMRELDASFTALPWSWSDPSISIEAIEYVLERNKWHTFTEARLSIPPKTYQLYFDGPSVSGCKWEGNELVILELSTRNEEGDCLTNIDIVLIRNPLRR
jgi:hypothetical protein